tara:strand:+ start:86 stop:343 length:258 start_codon:yes stop_codon:yes gene_type:complete
MTYEEQRAMTIETSPEGRANAARLMWPAGVPLDPGAIACLITDLLHLARELIKDSSSFETENAAAEHAELLGQEAVGLYATDWYG